VFLVHKGNVVDTFAGLPSEERLEDFINTGLLLEGMSKNKNLVDQMLVSADELKDEKNYEPAIKVYEEILKADEFEEYFSSKCLLNISLCYGYLSKEDECKEYLMKWRNKHKNHKLTTKE